MGGKIKVLFFGRLKDITGSREIQISDVEDIESLKAYLFDKFPKLKQEIFR